VTGLIKNTTYYVRAYARNAIEISYGGEENFTTYGTTNGLIAYFPFNGNSNDASGYNNNGTKYGGITWVTDRKGNSNSACNFNGTDAYISVPNSQSLQLNTNQLTFALWFNCRTTGGNKLAAFLQKNNATSDLPQYGFHLNPYNRINFGIMDNTNSIQWISYDYSFQYNQWYFLALTWDGSTVKIYINNLLVSTQSLNKQMKADTHPLEIGRDVGGAIEWYDGILDDLRIYNRALSNAEILNLYNQ
jgi:hypothetical protein